MQLRNSAEYWHKAVPQKQTTIKANVAIRLTILLQRRLF